LQSLLDWLIGLPAGWLYFIVVAAAFIENLVPPLPSDVVIAFGSFLAAQRGNGLPQIFVATWAGNIAGAVLVYALGRRYGAARLERRLAGRHAEEANARMKRMLERWGLAGIFLSRFIPGVRAIVPAFAGALRLPFLRTVIIMASASGIWYGIVTVMAYRVGADWDALRASLKHYGTTLAVIAISIVVAGIVIWAARRRRQPSTPPLP
jgi:membrane protein DedA with SNARE-associated domain